MTTGPESSPPKVNKVRRSRKSSRKPRLHLLKGEARCIGAGLRKIAALQLEAAVGELETGKIAPESIHDARTYIKKVRAIIQIASPAFPKPARRKLVARLRTTAASMGPLRDADVHLETLDQLLREHGLVDERHASLRDSLLKLASRRRMQTAPRIGKVIAALRSTGNAARTWPLGTLQSGDVITRIRRTYRQGRNALDLCTDSGEPDDFHTWRKLVKRLWYQLRLTALFWEGNADKVIGLAGAIGELAGRERDLTLLSETLRKSHGEASSRHMISIIEEELPGLRRKAIRKGRDLYHARPESFVKDLKL